MTVDLGRVQALQAEIIELIAGNVHDVTEGGWDGRFEMETFHVPPRRLGGDLIDKRFEDYLERYIAKHGDTPPAKARPWWKSVFGG